MIALVTGRQQKPGFYRLFVCMWVEERDSVNVDASNLQCEVKE